MSYACCRNANCEWRKMSKHCCLRSLFADHHIEKTAYFMPFIHSVSDMSQVKWITSTSARLRCVFVQFQYFIEKTTHKITYCLQDIFTPTICFVWQAYLYNNLFEIYQEISWNKSYILEEQCRQWGIQIFLFCRLFHPNLCHIGVQSHCKVKENV